MTNKSTSTKVSLFVIFVLVSAIFSVNGNVYAQQNVTLSEALNVTDAAEQNFANETETTVPVEEELLPTTTDGSTDGNSTGNATGTTENVTETVPVEEELLPTTTDGSTDGNSTGNATGTTENVTETVPVEEELLPTTTDGLVTGDATTAAPSDEAAVEEESSEAHSENATHASTVTRDSQTILLDGETLPEGDFIHLYDSTPYQIMNGHIAAKMPCNEDNATAVDVLIGQAPNLAPAELEFVGPLSTPGELCLYHVDVASDETTPITDIAIQNNSTDDIDFPATSTIVLGVNEIAPLSGDHNE